MKTLYKKLTSLFIVLAIFTLYLPTDAEAKRSSWGGSKSYKSSSWGSSKKSSSSFFSKKKKTKRSSYGGSYNKKTVTKRVVKKKPSYGGSYSQKSTKSKKPNYGGSYDSSKTSKPKLDSFQQAKVKKANKKKNKQALASFRNKQKKMKESKAAKTAPKTKFSSSNNYKNRLSGNGKTSDSYSTRKSNYYDNNHYNPPVYIRQTGGSWGGLDGFFLGYMLSDILSPSSHGAQYMYNNQNDPAVQAYLRDLREQSKENSELREQMHELDKQMAVMKAQGLVPQQGSIPEGIDPDIVYSKDYVDSHKDDFYDKNMEKTIKADSSNESGTGFIFIFLIFGVLSSISWFIFFRKS